MNLDYELSAIRAPVVAFPPFVEFEYLNPKGSPPGHILAAGDKSLVGNKVYRELFKFHKTQIILLKVVKCFSDILISMDISGECALLI